MPQMTRIRSTSVAAVGYDEDRHELSVTFVSGDTYVYAMVPPSVYRELLRRRVGGPVRELLGQADLSRPTRRLTRHCESDPTRRRDRIALACAASLCACG